MGKQTLVLNLFILIQTHVSSNYEGVSIYYLLYNELKTAFLPFIFEIFVNTANTCSTKTNYPPNISLCFLQYIQILKIQASLCS